MNIVIPEDLIYTTRLTETELLQELAVVLYQKEKLSLGQASKIAKMTQLQFQGLLGSRQINVHYDVAEFAQDLKTLQELGRI